MIRTILNFCSASVIIGEEAKEKNLGKGGTMEKTLWITGLGETMRPDFLKEAVQYPYGKALFLVPNLYFRNLVRRHGVVKTSTIDALPREILRLNGRENERMLISRDTQARIASEAIEYLVGKELLPYFRTLADKKGFCDSVVQLLTELETCHVTGEDFKNAVLSWNREEKRGGEKDKEIALILSAYEALMNERHLCDLNGLYDAALDVLQDPGAILPWEKLYFSEFNELTGLQMALVKALGKRVSISFGLFYDESRPDLSEATRKLEEDLLGDGYEKIIAPKKVSRPEDLAYFAETFPKATGDAVAAQHIYLGEASSVDSEIKMVLTDVKKKLKSGVAPHEILLLVRNLNDYQGLGRYMEEYGLLSTLADVTDLAGQPLPLFLTKLWEAALTKDDTMPLLALMKTTLMQELFHVDRIAVGHLVEESYIETPGFLLERISHLSGVSDLKPLFEALQTPKTCTQWRDYLDERLTEWDLVRTFGRLHQEGKVTLSEVKIMAQSEDFVRAFFDRLEALFEAVGSKDLSVGLGDIFSYWKEALIGTTITLTPSHEEGIRVMEASDIQGVPYPYVYILGVRDGLFPAISRESWLYSDEERTELAALDIPLGTSARRLARDRFFFASAVSLAEKEVHLSWFADDEGGASYYIERLRHFFTPHALPFVTYHSDVHDCYSEPQMVRYLMEAENLGEKEATYLADHVDAKILLRAQDEKNRFAPKSLYNGYLGPQEETLHLSASQLDGFLTCPFMYLFTHVWKLDVKEAKTAFPTPDVVGNLIHLTLSRFMGRHLGEALFTKELEMLWQELSEAYQAAYTEMERNGDIPRSRYSDHIRKSYEEWLKRWLRMEVDYEEKSPTGVKVCAVEKAFGRKGAAWPPYDLTVDGKKVYLSGQIDRIDRSESGYLIMDYKTGGRPTTARMDEGKAVQLPLYIKVLERNLGLIDQQIFGAIYGDVRTGRRVGGMWSSVGKAAKEAPKSVRGKDMEDVLKISENVIAAAVRRMRSGDFAAEPYNGKCPDYCPARDICRIKDNQTHEMMSAEEDANG